MHWRLLNLMAQSVSFFQFSLFVNFTENTLANLRLALYSNLAKLPMSFLFAKNAPVNSTVVQTLLKFKITQRTTITDLCSLSTIGGVIFFLAVISRPEVANDASIVPCRGLLR
jgi:hypothetical protein